MMGKLVEEEKVIQWYSLCLFSDDTHAPAIGYLGSTLFVIRPLLSIQVLQSMPNSGVAHCVCDEHGAMNHAKIKDSLISKILIHNLLAGQPL